MTPLALPDAVLKSKWDTWQQLQNNGLLAYTRAPEFNLSVGDREDAQAFRNFYEPFGLILDIGCGPQTYPSYLPETGQVVGIDPLIGEQPRRFSFVQGLGEYLPFRDETFDQILYASSLDHLIDPRRSLAEAKRCLKPDGRINLWMDGLASDGAAPRLPILRKGFKSLRRHHWFTEIGLRRTLSYIAVVSRMRVPKGASDCFHFAHFSAEEVFGWLNDLNLRITRRQEDAVGDSVFGQVSK